MYSVVILTLNEEKALPECLASLAHCPDVVILDSGSTDRTVEQARAAGARIYTRKFDSFAGQRNHAQASIPFKFPWVLHLDADERMTPELDTECRDVASKAPDAIDGFRIAPKMEFEGRWIPHCTDFPAYQARFVRAPQFRFIQVGHGQREAPDMRMANLTRSYVHNLSIESRDAWLQKHRRYAADEAAALIQSAGDATLGRLLSKSALERRRALKQFTARMPMRAAMRFVYQYILRRGFLDGSPGLTYCVLLARYEGFIADELRRMRASGGR
jgi:glycosyltransferase involved in cell wall biosynthesis